MADSKISELTDGGAPQGADVLVAVRSGSNVKTAIPSGGYARLTAAQVFSGGQRGAVTTLESASGSTAIDLSVGNVFYTLLDEDTTLANPTNQVAGQSFKIFIEQDAVTPRSVAYGSNFFFVGTTPSVTAEVGAWNVLYCDVLEDGMILASMQNVTDGT